jgi:hypothetical protein
MDISTSIFLIIYMLSYDYIFIRTKDSSNLCYSVRHGYSNEKICNKFLNNYDIVINNFTCPTFEKNLKMEKYINKYDSTEYVKSCWSFDDKELMYYQNINELNLTYQIKIMGIITGFIIFNILSKIFF